VMSKEQAATHAQVEEVSGAIDWPFLPSIGWYFIWIVRRIILQNPIPSVGEEKILNFLWDTHTSKQLPESRFDQRILFRSPALASCS
jgi:hypothetical protein